MKVKLVTFFLLCQRGWQTLKSDLVVQRRSTKIQNLLFSNIVWYHNFKSQTGFFLVGCWCSLKSLPLAIKWRRNLKENLHTLNISVARSIVWLLYKFHSIQQDFLIKEMTNFKTKSDLILAFFGWKWAFPFCQIYLYLYIVNYVIYRVQTANVISSWNNVNLSRQSKIVRSLYLTYLFFIKLFHTWHTWQFSKIYEFQ